MLIAGAVPNRPIDPASSNTSALAGNDRQFPSVASPGEAEHTAPGPSRHFGAEGLPAIQSMQGGGFRNNELPVIDEKPTVFTEKAYSMEPREEGRDQVSNEARLQESKSSVSQPISQDERLLGGCSTEEDMPFSPSRIGSRGEKSLKPMDADIAAQLASLGVQAGLTVPQKQTREADRQDEGIGASRKSLQREAPKTGAPPNALHLLS